ncbi:MAG: DUF4097 domain-containing protein [Clostridiales bacterium]|nr:DUF4097 domain-containing protein [Clostridiales bacterium]
MKIKMLKIASMCFLPLLMLTGCGNQQSTSMVNDLSFSLDEIKKITISYDDENISFFEGVNENLIIKEYMSKDKESYHANVTQENNEIKVSEGGKPFSKKNFNRYIKVYLPASYSEDLKITTTNGNIDLSDVSLDISSIRIDSTSGEIKINEMTATDIHLSSTHGKMELGNIIGDNIKIETTNGNVSCKSIEGNVAYTSTSGKAEFLSAKGSGTYKANNSGKLKVNYEEVTGDLSLYNKNDNIDLTIPSTLDFDFKATTKNGSVDTNFQGSISVKGRTTSGTIGDNPTVAIKVETKNGNIKVTR